MNLFLIICAVLLLVALPFVVLPLWRKTGDHNDVLRDAANLEILRDQSAELEADLRNGLLTQDAYEQGKRELQARLLDEVKVIPRDTLQAKPAVCGSGYEAASPAPDAAQHRVKAAIPRDTLQAKPAVCGSGYEAASPAPDAAQHRVKAAIPRDTLQAKPAVCGSGYEAASPAPDAAQHRVKAATEAPASVPRNPAKILALLLAVLLPVASVLLYAKIGNIKALQPQERNAAADGFGVLRSEAALQELEKKLEQQPENPEGWWMLARSYNEMQRFTDAVRAFQQLVKLVPDEAQIWASYADAYAMTNNRSLLGEPTRFLGKALELDGNNTLALALSGTAAMERGDYAAAITHWTKLVNLLPPDNPMLQDISNGIQQAREFLSKQKGGKEKLAQLSFDKEPKKSAADLASTIAGKVSISPALAGKAAQTDTLFIFARPAQGQKMPIAVLRKQVKDLPLQFTLDDSMALQSQVKLSGFDKVIVTARVSKSGDAVAQRGDLQGSSDTVKPGTNGLSILIDSVVQ